MWEEDPLSGTLIGGRYRIRGVLGRGGMGVVYDAVHEELGRPVALKVVSNAHADDATVIDRFMREARVVAQIGHPNIVAVHDLGRLDDDRPYLVMERLYGASFFEILSTQGVIEPPRVVELLAGVASALEVVHGKGIVHRDIKLENLMLCRLDDGTQAVKLLDFGIAAIARHSPDAKRLTAQGMITGTPLYISPEGALGDAPDHRADIYSLAVVAYMMLTGYAPFDAENPVVILSKKLSEEPPPLSGKERVFSLALEQVMSRGLARHVEDRFGSAKAFVLELARAAEEGDEPAGAPVLDAETASGLPARDVSARVAAPTAVAPTLVPAPVVPTEVVPSPSESPTIARQISVETEQVRSRGTPAVTEVGGAVERRGGRDLFRQALFGLVPLVMAIGVFLILRATRPTAVPTPVGPPPAAVAPADVNGAAAPSEAPPTRPEAQPGAESARVEPAAGPGVEPGDAHAADARAGAPRAGDVNAGEARAEAPPREVPARRGTRARRVEPAPVEKGPEVTLPAVDAERAAAMTRTGMKALVDGRLPSAIESFREATNASPRYAPAWRGLGLANEKMGRKSEALSAFRHYLTLASGEDAGLVRQIRARVAELERGS